MILTPLTIKSSGRWGAVVYRIVDLVGRQIAQSDSLEAAEWIVETLNAASLATRLRLGRQLSFDTVMSKANGGRS